MAGCGRCRLQGLVEALILRGVLGCTAREGAATMAATEASVKSALPRASATMGLRVVLPAAADPCTRMTPLPKLVGPVVAAGSLRQLRQPVHEVGELELRPWCLSDARSVVLAYADPSIQRSRTPAQ